MTESWITSVRGIPEFATIRSSKTYVIAEQKYNGSNSYLPSTLWSSSRLPLLFLCLNVFNVLLFRTEDGKWRFEAGAQTFRQKWTNHKSSCLLCPVDMWRARDRLVIFLIYPSIKWYIGKVHFQSRFQQINKINILVYSRANFCDFYRAFYMKVRSARICLHN